MVVPAGLTTNGTPVPTKVPPQDPEYHCQLAPEPSEPPTILSVDELPAQIGLGAAVALVAAVDPELTVTTTLTQAVVLHGPSALTKYDVVTAGDTEILDPEPAKMPPETAPHPPEYQVQDAPEPSEPPATVRVVELPEQIGFGAAEALAGAVERVFTVTVKLAHAVVLQVPSART